MGKTGYNLNHLSACQRFEELGNPPTSTRRRRLWYWFGRRFQALAWWCDDQAES